ncbi:hypothetical protein Ga0080559_TMP1774 [Salipiger profundus]|uniref:Uncharacterized protein n=1 Tax=Salipiger profundus TaxID=1229727 RepID=A0A1U7D3C3_9RHOB|nr:hypothetical protein Ga0080559_TMP1774 [Salipiger profundus]
MLSLRSGRLARVWVRDRIPNNTANGGYFPRWTARAPCFIVA